MKQYSTILGNTRMIKYIFIDLKSMERNLKRKKQTIIFHRKLPFVEFNPENWMREKDQVIKRFPFFISILVRFYIWFYKVILKAENKEMRKVGGRKLGSYKLKEFDYFYVLTNFELLMDLFENPSIVILTQGHISLTPDMVRYNLSLLGFECYKNIVAGLNYPKEVNKGEVMTSFLSDRATKISECIIIDDNQLVGGLEERRIDANNTFSNTSDRDYNKIIKKIKEGMD